MGRAAGRLEVSADSGDIGGAQGSSARKMGREHCSKGGRVCATAVGMRSEGRYFPHKLGAEVLDMACSWQGCAAPGSGRQREQMVTPSPAWAPSVPDTSARQEFSGRRRRTKPLTIHSLPSTYSLTAHLDRVENNSMQEQGQWVQAAWQEVGWDHPDMAENQSEKDWQKTSVAFVPLTQK